MSSTDEEDEATRVLKRGSELLRQLEEVADTLEWKEPPPTSEQQGMASLIERYKCRFLQGSSGPWYVTLQVHTTGDERVYDGALVVGGNIVRLPRELAKKLFMMADEKLGGGL